MEEVAVHTKRLADDQEKVGHHQADQEHSVGRPGPRVEAADEEDQAVPHQAQDKFHAQDWCQEGRHHGEEARWPGAEASPGDPKAVVKAEGEEEEGEGGRKGGSEEAEREGRGEGELRL